MDFDEFNVQADALVEQIKLEAPVAIVRFGSSIRPDEYIPGVSDLDMLVVSERPIREIPNDVGFEYFFNHPGFVVDAFLNGDPFVMNALMYGEVLYDPQGFISRVKDLAENEGGVKPTQCTLFSIVGGIENQLNSAMNRYFSGDTPEGDKVKLLRNVSSVVKGVGMLYALQATQKLPDSYSSILSVIRVAQPEIAELMDSTRACLINHKDISSERSDSVFLGDDELGNAITGIEGVYFSNLSRGNVLIPTNDLIEGCQGVKGKLDKTLAVKIDTFASKQLILANQQQNNFLFGVVETNTKALQSVGYDVPEENLDELYYQLRLLR